jgi:hypothetical protein
MESNDTTCKIFSLEAKRLKKPGRVTFKTEEMKKYIE